MYSVIRKKRLEYYIGKSLMSGLEAVKYGMQYLAVKEENTMLKQKIILLEMNERMKPKD